MRLARGTLPRQLRCLKHIQGAVIGSALVGLALPWPGSTTGAPVFSIDSSGHSSDPNRPGMDTVAPWSAVVRASGEAWVPPGPAAGLSGRSCMQVRESAALPAACRTGPPFRSHHACTCRTPLVTLFLERVVGHVMFRANSSSPHAQWAGGAGLAQVAVNLNGYTKGARIEIFALRPAPVQMSYMGFPATTGVDFLPYLITDKAPPAHARTASCRLPWGTSTVLQPAV